MMETIEAIILRISNFIWSPDQGGGIIFLTFLVGTGVYLTFRLGFPQLRYFKHAWELTLGKYDNPKDPGEVTHFQALSAALSGTVGIGNIAGVATAIYLGGPGAIFWLWVTAFFGMATKLTCCSLALKYRIKNPDGSYSGGPMYTIERGIGGRWKVLAVLFSIFTAIASFGIGNMVQANTVAEQLNYIFPWLPKYIIGIIMSTFLGLVIIGGIRRIAKVASFLVPLMALIYVIGTIIVLIKFYYMVPAAFKLIFYSAFNGTSAVGGFIGVSVGEAIRWGIARGIFSNEAGLGSSPTAHAVAKTTEPIREGFVAMLEPFVDTIVICTLTGISITVTGSWHEKVEATLKPSEILIYASPVNDEIQLKDYTRLYKRGIITIKNGKFIGSGLYFVNHKTVTEDISFYLEDKPLEGVLHIENGKIVMGELFLNQSYKIMSEEQFNQIRIKAKTVLKGPLLSAHTFNKAIPGGELIVALCMLLFAFSTAISWSYYGDRSIGYLLGIKAVLPYRILYTIAHFIGTITTINIVWGIADIANAFMALPNLISLWVLAGVVVQMKRNYSIPHKK